MIREISGKKMNTKLRKVMDDFSEETVVSLQSCQRQVGNLLINLLIKVDVKMSKLL